MLGQKGGAVLIQMGRAQTLGSVSVFGERVMSFLRPGERLGVRIGNNGMRHEQALYRGGMSNCLILSIEYGFKARSRMLMENVNPIHHMKIGGTVKLH